MPFSDITILIAEDDIAVSQLWERVCSEIGFRVVTVQTIKEGLVQIKHADILVADLMLADGEASLLVSTWVETNGGPLLCVSGVISPDDVRDYILRGAYNAFQKTEFSTEMLRTLVVRYGKWVMLHARLDKLEKKIRLQQMEFERRSKLQQRAIAVLAVITLGKQLWDTIAPLFF